MPRKAKIQGVKTVKKRRVDGTMSTFHYHRDTMRRLNGEPGSPEFKADFEAAERSLRNRDENTLAGLLREYAASPRFRGLRATTQREYVRIMTKIEGAFGDMPLAAVEDQRARREFMTWRDEVAEVSGLREADHCLATLSASLSWAVHQGMIEQNRVLGFARLHKADRSHKIWLQEHVDAFMSHAPLFMQQALVFALHTGQRQGDCRAIKWSQYDGERIIIQQSKRQAVVTIPATRVLKGMLDAMPRLAETILTTPTGKPWDKRNFARQWKRVSDAAGIDDLHFQDLRGTTVTLLAEAGCSVVEIASITGHSLRTASTILEHYLARTDTVSRNAITKFETSESAQFANRLETVGKLPQISRVRGGAK